MGLKKIVAFLLVVSTGIITVINSFDVRATVNHESSSVNEQVEEVERSVDEETEENRTETKETEDNVHPAGGGY